MRFAAPVEPHFIWISILILKDCADVLVAQMIYSILIYVRDCLSSKIDHVYPDIIETKPESRFWLKMVEAVKDPYAVERLSEEILRQLATANVSDTEAYWVLWLLFHQSLKQQTTISSLKEGRNAGGLISIVQRLVGTWSTREFVQSAPMEQQAYVTAAVGLSLEMMSKEELEASKDVLQSLLQGVSCRA
ncbi:hypothetical protein ACLOJK_008222 [Asimina triloba]